jgi:hypothetical protein
MKYKNKIEHAKQIMEFLTIMTRCYKKNPRQDLKDEIAEAWKQLKEIEVYHAEEYNTEELDQFLN